MDKDVKYWYDLSVYDKGSAEAMYKAGRYLYVLFMCQQVVEKMLKGILVNNTGKFPPRIHDLIKLADIAKIDFDPDRLEFMRELTLYYIETRYPSDIENIGSSVDKKLANLYLTKTKEFLKWLKAEIK